MDFTKQGTELPKGLVELNDPSFTVVSGDNQNPTTRLTTDGKWEASDEVGVGFINWFTSTGSGKYSTGTRHPNKTGWVNAADGGDLYANHRLYRSNDAWKFETVVYEGLHYAYYPLQGDHTSVAPLTVTLGETQEFGKEDEFITKGLFAVSPLYDLENDAAGKAPKATFALNTISNRLKLNLELANAGSITDPIVIKKVTVAATKSGNADNEIFGQKAAILGGKLPVADYTAQLAWEGLADADKTAAKLAEAIATDAKTTATNFANNLLGATTALDYAAPNARTAAMSSDVKGHTGLTSTSKTYGVNLFTFPVDKTTESTKLTVTVETNYGTVTIESGANDADAADSKDQQQIIKDNNEKLASLLKILNGANDAPKGTDGKAISFQDYGKYAGATLKLDMAKAELTEIAVASDAEWTEAVKIASQVNTVTTINVNGNVTADLTNLPANVTTINVADNKTLTISGEIKNELEIVQGGSGSNLKVAKEASLNIKGELLEATAVEFDVAFNNFGTVTVDNYSTLTAKTTNGAINNHGEVINNGKLVLNALFTNCKDKKGVASADHTCTGILRNNGAIDGTALMLTNNGVIYQAGTITTVTFNAAGADSKAISINGGALPTNCGESLEANVESSKELSAALAAGAKTINAMGVIALNETLPGSDAIQLNLQNGAEFYIQENAVKGSATLSITAESGSCLIKSAASVYLSIQNLAVDPTATLAIGEEGDTYAKKTAINVETLSYPKGAKIINNGWVYAEKGSATNTGTWEGMDANKKETSATDSELVAISSAMTTR
ncbi:MAG: hypothetical protein LUF04_06470 [Bacteroides sp.]|nr:hypothetical protein [Bacteroides sp.]